MSYGVGHRRGSDPALLWLWCKLAATAPIRPLAWEPPYAAATALEKAKSQKQNETKKPFLSSTLGYMDQATEGQKSLVRAFRGHSTVQAPPGCSGAKGTCILAQTRPIGLGIKPSQSQKWRVPALRPGPLGSLLSTQHGPLLFSLSRLEGPSLSIQP